MIRSKTTFDPFFENHPILTNEALGFGCKETMLLKAKKLWSKAIDLPDVGRVINFCTNDKFDNKQENGIRIDRE